MTLDLEYNWAYIQRKNWLSMYAFFFICCCDGVRLSQSNCAVNVATVYPWDDTWVNMGHRWNDTDRENRRTRRKSYLRATLSTISPTWSALRTNPLHRGEKLVTNHLSYGTALEISNIILHALWSGGLELPLGLGWPPFVDSFAGHPVLPTHQPDRIINVIGRSYAHVHTSLTLSGIKQNIRILCS
jgi:hypothetical protein